VDDLGLYWNVLDQRCVFGTLDLGGLKIKTIIRLVLEENLVDVVWARINVNRLDIRPQNVYKEQPNCKTD